MTYDIEEADKRAVQDRQQVLEDGRRLLARLKEALIAAELKEGRELARRWNERAGYLAPTTLKKGEDARFPEPELVNLSKGESDGYRAGRAIAAALNKRRGL